MNTETRDETRRVVDAVLQEKLVGLLSPGLLCLFTEHLADAVLEALGLEHVGWSPLRFGEIGCDYVYDTTLDSDEIVGLAAVFVLRGLPDRALPVSESETK